MQTAKSTRQQAGGLLSAFRLPPPDFLLFLAALALYTFTLAPGLLPADSGEYQLAGATLGVAHPPGYALYTLVSWLISRGPVSPALAINFLSALLAAFTLVFVSRATRVITGSPWAGLGAAAMLGLSTTFWAQATTANVRMPAAFAVAWAVERLVSFLGSPSPPVPLSRWERGGSGSPLPAAGRGAGGDRSLLWLAFALGLAVSHHASTVFIAAVLGLYAVWWLARAGGRRLVWQRLPVAALAGLIPFLAWLYFPLNALYLGGPPSLATWPGFIEHITAQGFRGDMLAFATAEALPERFRVLGVILPFQWNWVLLALSALGAVRLFSVRRSLFTALLTAWAAHTFIAITYRAPQTTEYLLPSYVLMAVTFGVAGAALLRATQWARLAGAAVIVAALGFQWQATFPGYRALAQDDSTRAFAQSALDAAPPKAVLLAPWHWSTPLWYLQHMEGQRADVEVRYVVPRTGAYGQDWVSEIQSALPARPVMVTSFFKQEFAASGLRFSPLPTALNPAWQVADKPFTAAPPALTDARSFGEIEFLGYSPHSIFQSPDSLEVFAAWRVAGPPRDLNFFVHLIGPDGLLYGQMDVNYPAARYVSGEVLLDRYTLDVLPEAAAGTYTLMAGAYTPDGTRVAETTLTPLALEAPSQFSSSSLRPSSLNINFGHRLALIGSNVAPITARPGAAITVELDFLALRPITEDLTIVVTLAGEGWRTQVNRVPVDGALPTLKWITGSRVRDRYTLTIPAEAMPGVATVTLGWFDTFTQRDLPPLDRDLAQRGPGIPLGTVTLSP
jgi:hypothetical protein